MQKENLIVLSAFILVLGLTVTMIFLTREGDDTDEDTVPERIAEEEFIRASTVDEEGVRTHTTADDCWFAYEGRIYDMSEVLQDIQGLEEKHCGRIIEDELSETVLQEIAPYHIADTYESTQSDE